MLYSPLRLKQGKQDEELICKFLTFFYIEEKCILRETQGKNKYLTNKQYNTTSTF